MGDDVLPDGTHIAPGDVVMWVTYAMGRSPDIWGRDAADFRPERCAALVVCFSPFVCCPICHDSVSYHCSVS